MSEEDEKKAWENWEVESDSSSDDDSEEGWMNVDSDGDDEFDVSDSDDEKKPPKPAEDAATPKEEPKRISTLATTKVRLISHLYGRAYRLF